MCVYPVGVTDGGLPLRVISELAPIKLGRDEFTSDCPDIMLAAHVLFYFSLFLSFCGTSKQLARRRDLIRQVCVGGELPVSTVAIQPMYPADVIQGLGAHLARAWTNRDRSKRTEGLNKRWAVNSRGLCMARRGKAWGRVPHFAIRVVQAVRRSVHKSTLAGSGIADVDISTGGVKSSYALSLK